MDHGWVGWQGSVRVFTHLVEAPPTHPLRLWQVGTRGCAWQEIHCPFCDSPGPWTVCAGGLGSDGPDAGLVRGESVGACLPQSGLGSGKGFSDGVLRAPPALWTVLGARGSSLGHKS